MQEGYFKTAWNDIKESPGWKSKMFLMGLLLFIPIFGPIVVYGYLYGWARDAAWGVQGPLPKRVFGNEDGKLYSRGFYIWVLAIVLSLVPGAVFLVYMIFSGLIAAIIATGGGSIFAALALTVFGIIFLILSIALTLFIALFAWVGGMRISIYGNLSAGFQIKKIWAMIHHDFGGLIRIVGMLLLLSFVMSIAVGILIGLVFLLVFIVGIIAGGGNLFMSYNHIDSSYAGIILAISGIALLVSTAAAYLGVVATVWVETVVIRALGYWVKQFDVPSWRGQEDPMPFELGSTGQGVSQHQSEEAVSE